MSWVRRWVELVIYYQIQNFLSYLQKIAKFFSKFLLFPFLNFHVSGSPEYVSKQLTQLIVELNSSLRHIIVTLAHSKIVKTRGEQNSTARISSFSRCKIKFFDIYIHSLHTYRRVLWIFHAIEWKMNRNSNTFFKQCKKTFWNRFLLLIDRISK